MSYLVLDPVPSKMFRIGDVNRGDKVTMSKLEIISHTATHVDTPLLVHLDAGAMLFSHNV